MKFPISYDSVDNYKSWGVECEKVAKGIESKQKALLSEALSKIDSRQSVMIKEYIYNGNFNKIGNTRYIPTGWQLNTNIATCYMAKYLTNGADIVQYISTRHTKEVRGRRIYLHTSASPYIEAHLYVKTPTSLLHESVLFDGVETISIYIDVPDNAEYMYVRYVNTGASSQLLYFSKLNISSDSTKVFPSVHSEEIGCSMWAATISPPYRTIKMDGTSYSSYDYPILYASVFDYYNIGGFSSTFTSYNWNSLGRGIFIKNASSVSNIQSTVQTNAIIDHKHIDAGHTHTVTAYNSTGGVSLASGANLAVAVATAGANNTWLESVSTTISDAVLNTGGGAAIRLDANETRFKNTALGLFMVAE